MNIKLTGAADARDGYGEITQNLALALDQLGHSVWVNPVSVWYKKETLKPRTIELLTPNKPDFELIIMYPTYDFQGIFKNAGIMTMYEAHRCPDVWTKRLNQLHLPIYAPSMFVKKMFEDSGVTVPIMHLPLGVDNHFYSPIKRKFPEGRPFRFLTLGKMEPRKNMESLVRCFLDNFEKENVELILKTRERFLSASVRNLCASSSQIRVMERTISEEDLKILYHSSDAFVYPSRGEGFAFPPRNAIATGMPTIVNGWSALAEIPGAIKILPAGHSPMPACGFSYGQEKYMHMADVDEPALMYQMYKLATDEAYYNEKVKEVLAVKQYNWIDTANAFIEMIKKYAK
jgi:glycosyltransferase involved in cell wall biosynthesis